MSAYRQKHYFFFVMLFVFSKFIIADQCVCSREIAGPPRRINASASDELPAVAVDTKNGNYFVLTTQVNFTARIFDYKGRLKRIFPLALNNVISRDVAFTSNRNRYLIVWSSLLESSGSEQ